MLFGDWFDGAIFDARGAQPAATSVGEEFHGPLQFVLHGFTGPAVYLAALGAFAAWFLYLKRPDIPGALAEQYSGLHRVLMNKYYFDWFNENVLARGGRALGGLACGRRRPDDHRRRARQRQCEERSACLSGVAAQGLQTGYLYNYAFAMIIGLAVMVGWFVFRT